MARKKAEKVKPSDDEVLLVRLYNEVLERDPTDLEKSRWLAAMARDDYVTTEVSIRATLMTRAEYKATEPKVAEPTPEPAEAVEDTESE